MVVLVAVATAFSLLWRRSVQETCRAEGRKLIALGRVELDRNPPAALAFARASLEVVDSTMPGRSPSRRCGQRHPVRNRGCGQRGREPGALRSFDPHSVERPQLARSEGG
jgi:hypothetical protein